MGRERRATMEATAACPTDAVATDLAATAMRDPSASNVIGARLDAHGYQRRFERTDSKRA